MPQIDPSAVLLTSLIVGLMAMGLLALSSAATAQVRQGVVLWMAGDAMASLARLGWLIQPGVVGATGLAWLTAEQTARVNDLLIIVSAALHTLSLREAFSDRPTPRRLLAFPLLLPLAYLAITAVLHDRALHLLTGLIGTMICMVWTFAIAWPHRRQFRGAWLVCATMGFFLSMAAASQLALALGRAPPTPQGRVAPLPVLIIDLTSALAMTMAFMLLQFERMQHRMEALGITDPLTQLLNRRGFLRQLDAQWNGSRRRQAPLSLALLDLDHFKRINDTLGHAQGDAVLTGFAQRARSVLRQTDVLGRWGGEEFVLLMPGTDPAAAARVTDRLRAAVAAAPLAAGTPIVTVSAGVTGLLELPAGPPPDSLFSRADASLYQAKLQRNCVRTDAPDLAAAPAAMPGPALAV